MVGLYEPLMARNFCDSALVMNITRSAATAGLREYLDTASCQPPRVAAFWPSAPPLGRAETPILPEILESLALPSDQAYGQLRMKAALPFWNTPRASSSA